MTTRLRYGELLSHIRSHQRPVSFNRLAEVEGMARRRYSLRGLDYWRLLAPYFGLRAREQFWNVMPIVLALALFQVFLLRTLLEDATLILVGVLVIIAGLVFFMDGIKLGLMPLAENIGFGLPSKASTATVVAVAFILGVLATLAEPAIGALQSAGELISRDEAPLLHYLLNGIPFVLMGTVALGVGAAVVLGNVRFLYGIRLNTLVILIVTPSMALTAYLAGDPLLEPVLGLAWDCGAITTGPVTVPLVLAIGIGLSAAAGREDNPLSGFGIVTLASLFPAIAVMILGLVVSDRATIPPQAAVDSFALPPWMEIPAVAAAVGAARAVMPLALFLFFVQFVLLRTPIRERLRVYYGMGVALVGMVLFNLGLTYGLGPLGNQAGGHLPIAFVGPDGEGAGLYPYWVGIMIALTFAFLVGFGATMAEPALNAMGVTVETLTDGAFPRYLLIRAVALGVAFGMALGVTKLLFHVPLGFLLLPAYGVALALTVVSSEEYVNLAWDSAGVTTGPVTVPLVLALGLGLGEAMDATEGFGVLAMASVGPIVSVLVVGQWITWSLRRRHRQAISEAETETSGA
ncbi:MAG: DUF1538 domain-containing protein [Alphaproteobacteria bacterium]|nr:DUF1538 domain-containing protein [Alphaproteobacteria bacterium]